MFATHLSRHVSGSRGGVPRTPSVSATLAGSFSDTLYDLRPTLDSLHDEAPAAGMHCPVQALPETRTPNSRLCHTCVMDAPPADNQPRVGCPQRSEAQRPAIRALGLHPARGSHPAGAPADRRQILLAAAGRGRGARRVADRRCGPRGTRRVRSGDRGAGRSLGPGREHLARFREEPTPGPVDLRGPSFPTAQTPPKAIRPCARSGGSPSKTSEAW